jgi:hypothetical protein
MARLVISIRAVLEDAAAIFERVALGADQLVLSGKD